MNTKTILKRLAEVANELDDRNMTKEADAISGVMQRVAQVQGWSQWNYLNNPNNKPEAFDAFDKAFGYPFFNSKLQEMASSAQTTPEALKYWGSKSNDELLAYNGTDPVQSNAVQYIKQSRGLHDFMRDFSSAPASQAALSTSEADLIKRYLGWAFHALAVKKVSVPAARAALEHHLRARKQSPEFIQKTLQAFDAQLASQKAFQGQQ